MKLKNFLPFIFFAFVTILFFYQTIFFQKIPFPGDLLLAEYHPWRYLSFFGFSPGAMPHKAQYFDVITQLYPWKSYVIDSFKSGAIPLWNPFNFSGHPLLANFQSAALSPLNVLYLIFDQKIAWSISVLLQPMLAMIFTYLYLRKINLSVYPAIFGSIAYSLCLYMGTFLEYNTVGHTIALLPLILYSIESLASNFSTKYIFLFVVSILLSLFSGHIQIFGFIILFSIAYTTVKFRKKLYSLVGLILLYIFSLGIGAVQLIPTLELIGESARVPQNYDFLLNTLLLKPSQLILFLSPDIFGNPVTRNYLINDTYPTNAIYFGTIPFLLIFLSFQYLKNNYYVKYFLFATLILLILLVNNPISVLIYKIEIPLLSTGSPSNAIFLLSFSLSVLAAFGFERLFSDKKLRSIKLILPVFILFVLVWILLFTKLLVGIVNQFLISTIIVSLFGLVIIFLNLRPQLVKFLKPFIILILIFDLFYYFLKFNPFVKSNAVYPSTELVSFLQNESGLERVWGLGNANIASNITTHFRIYSPEGYDPLYPKLYGEFIHSSKYGELLMKFDNTTRSDARIAPIEFPGEFLTNDYRKRVLNVLGVKYFLDNQDSNFRDLNSEIVYEKEGLKVYLNNAVYPRVFLADSYEVYNSPQEFSDKFFDKNFDPTKTILVNEEIKEAILSRNDERGSVEVVKYDPNRIELISKTQASRLLFLSDTFYPGWKAFVNGNETKIYRAHYAFRSVVVPEGVNRVEFLYQPESFSFGIKTSIISVVLLIGFIFMRKKYAN